MKVHKSLKKRQRTGVEKRKFNIIITLKYVKSPP